RFLVYNNRQIPILLCWKGRFVVPVSIVFAEFWNRELLEAETPQDRADNFVRVEARGRFPSANAFASILSTHMARTRDFDRKSFRRFTAVRTHQTRAGRVFGSYPAMTPPRSLRQPDRGESDAEADRFNSVFRKNSLALDRVAIARIRS